MRHPFGEVVRVFHFTAGAQDAHGNVTAGFDAGTDWNCAVVPSSTSEPEEPGRTPVVEGLTAYGPPDMVVGPHDEAEYRGERYRVVGEVGAPQNPFTGKRPGVFFRMEKVTG